jgi:hypothetical protein
MVPPPAGTPDATDPSKADVVFKPLEERPSKKARKDEEGVLGVALLEQRVSDWPDFDAFSPNLSFFNQVSLPFPSQKYPKTVTLH